MAATQATVKNDAPLVKEEGNGEAGDDPLGGFIVADEADDGEGGEVVEGEEEGGACENGSKLDSTEGELESSNELNHPLKDALENYEPPENLLGETEVSGPAFMGEFPVHEVTSDLNKTAEVLKKETQIGVYCALSGKEKQLCYLVISTKAADYLIDLLVIKDVTPLAEIFADPNIVKVMFNHKMSLYYLQQHLKLYCINVFAVDMALESLGEPKSDMNLNVMLLNKYGITRLDNLDFTKRPLDMLLRTNLQSSSHFLVHMYCKLRNRLVTENKCLAETLKAMNKACLASYKSGQNVHREALIGEIKALHQAQLAVLDRLNLWRNRVAKVLDKNPNQILDKQCLKVLSMLLPEDMDLIKSYSKSDYVKKEAAEIQRIIKDARTKYPAGFISKVNMSKFLKEPAPKRPGNFQESAAKKPKVVASPVQTQPKTTPTASPAAKPAVPAPKPKAPQPQSGGGQAKNVQGSQGGQARGYQGKNFQSRGGGGQSRNYQGGGGPSKNFQSHGFSVRPNPAVFGSSSGLPSLYRNSMSQSQRGGYSNSSNLNMIDHRLRQMENQISGPNRGRGGGMRRRMRPMGGDMPYDPFARN